MTTARSTIVPPGEPGYYHCISRCVRQGFLCGYDAYSKTDYEHRRQWIRQRLEQLADIFAIDVGAYAVMSNHLHLVLRLDPDRARTWSSEEVVIRRAMLFPISRDAQGYPQLPSDEAISVLASDETQVQKWRERLSSLSWFMRCLKENIARRANREDGVGGRFWEGRFKSIALLDEAAVLACSTYVDLNPIRAGLAETLEASNFTSVQERIFNHVGVKQTLARRSSDQPRPKSHHSPESWLCPLASSTQDNEAQRKPFLSIDLQTYLRIVEWTGMQVAEGKTGVIPSDIEPVLQRLNIRETRWVETVTRYEHVFFRVIGQFKAMAKAAERGCQQWFQGCGFSKQAFKS